MKRSICWAIKRFNIDLAKPFYVTFGHAQWNQSHARSFKLVLYKRLINQSTLLSGAGAGGFLFYFEVKWTAAKWNDWLVSQPVEAFAGFELAFRNVIWLDLTWFDSIWLLRRLISFWVSARFAALLLHCNALCHASRATSHAPHRPAISIRIDPGPCVQRTTSPYPIRTVPKTCWAIKHMDTRCSCVAHLAKSEHPAPLPAAHARSVRRT